MLKEKSVLHELERLLDQERIITNPVELIPFEVDAALHRGIPIGVVLPKSVEEVQHVMRWSAESRTPLVARGAGTGLSGGAIADHSVIVGFSRMNSILEFDEKGRSALVEPGVVNLTLANRAKMSGLYYPPDPASDRASTLGGNFAENAGGPHCFKYGVTTNYVTGLEVILTDGRRVKLGGRALDYPEYDLCGLVVGSEGTLAMVTQAAVRLKGNPPGVSTLKAVFDSLDTAGNAVSDVISSGLIPSTMEMMDQQIIRIVEEFAHAGLPTDAEVILLVEVDGYPSSLKSQLDEVARILQSHGGSGLQTASSPQEREQLWYARKSAAGAVSRLAPAYIPVDITVPRSKLAETLAEVNEVCERYQLRAGHVFHAGDGNLHPLLLIEDPDDPQVIQTVLDAERDIARIGTSKNGSITGEHGVGLEKREFLSIMYNPVELSAMRDVKEVFDPQHLLNPGKIFPSEMAEVDIQKSDTIPPQGVFMPADIGEAAQGLAALSTVNRKVSIGSGQRAPLELENVWLSTSSLSGIHTYAREDLFVTAGAGTPLDELQSFLKKDNMQVALASPWPESTIGGIVSQNINSPLRMRYGSVRDLILAMNVVLADGRMIQAGRPVVKNVAGYDLPKVFVGSYGTLGLIVDVTFKLIPLPLARRTLLVPVENLHHGLDWAERLLPFPLVASSFVLSKDVSPKGATGNPYQLTYSVDGWPEDVDAELELVRRELLKNGAPAPIEVDAPTGVDLWQEFMRAGRDDLVVRVAVAPKDVIEYVHEQAAQLENTRFLVDLPSGFVYALAGRVQPSGAAAWLVKLRRAAISRGGYAIAMNVPDEYAPDLDRWGYRPEAMELMQRLKARWDPMDILNPGAFLPGT